MSTLAATTNGHRPSPEHWRKMSVKSFFSQIPWEGSPLVEFWGETTSQDESIEAGLDMRLSVREFFQRFPWNGKPEIAAPKAPLEVQPEVEQSESLTLDAFADLF